MKKILKKDSKKFFNEVTKSLLAIGAIQIQEGITFKDKRVFKLETSVGKLTISLYEDQSYCFTVFSIFEDVARASQKFNCNPHTGKYNTHVGVIPVEDAIETCIDAIEMTL